MNVLVYKVTRKVMNILVHRLMEVWLTKNYQEWHH